MINGDNHDNQDHDRHSVHWDSAAHASSGLETLDFPPRNDLIIWFFYYYDYCYHDFDFDWYDFDYDYNDFDINDIIMIS